MVLVPIQRTLLISAVNICLNMTFSYAAESDINSGIISTTFSSSVIFTVIMFWYKYHQTLGKFEIIGCLLIIASVLLIGFGGS
mmetsp:Transcript_5488/g.9301  ORF Transcript_5488/g.9301 Transcript_5488/m.9301 type:complete len:83 (-) Transcript_5488:599-847(-)